MARLWRGRAPSDTAAVPASRRSAILGVLVAATWCPTLAASLSGASRRLGNAALQPALCESLLDETYGALRGWSPSQDQLRRLCVGLLPGASIAAGIGAVAAAHTSDLCSTFALQTTRASKNGLLATHSVPSLAQLKEQVCASAEGASAVASSPQPPPVLPSPFSLAFWSSWWRRYTAGSPQGSLVQKRVMPPPSASPAPRAAVPAAVVGRGGTPGEPLLKRPTADELLQLRSELLAGGLSPSLSSPPWLATFS
eukprot:CAMPEP_0170286310 /NCGR_PEP_ID=MMETSP0116_2-20130129/43209_1 /TAXON_ID=400756 /ORGANISM="Durinskia baltica, Strain CSIRO CS-38" /LENGTH=253 /DNA_ID=CAMNT_0010537721 /DNA_START=8 /DNA_END=766 /DNA_ORIENTATION=+